MGGFAWETEVLSSPQVVVPANELAEHDFDPAMEIDLGEFMARVKARMVLPRYSKSKDAGTDEQQRAQVRAGRGVLHVAVPHVACHTLRRARWKVLHARARRG
jgi:hypothetical protein